MIVAVDTETRGLDTRKFVCGCILIEKKEPEIYYRPDMMYERLTTLIEKEKNRGHKVYIYAHRHEYDFYTYARENWDNIKFRYISFNPFIVMYGKTGLFLDSFSIFPMGLEQLGEMMGIKKMKIHPKLMDDKEEINFTDLQEIARYCKRDTEIVMKAILFLKKKLKDAGNEPRRLITAGQIAISTFTSYLKKEMLWEGLTTPEDRKNIIKTKYERAARTAFRGGRNEALQVGSVVNATGLDINSLYPYIMTQMKFPDLKSEKLNRSNPSLEGIGLADCVFKVPKIPYGTLPIRYKKHMLFPTKERLILSSWWTKQEARKAIENGYELVRLNKTIDYNEGKNIFSEYMANLYDERMRCSGADRLIIKLMMNSLFGKFGQKNIKKEIKFIPRRNIIYYPEWKIEGVMGASYAISMTKEMKSRYFVNPVIPAIITADARLILLKQMEKIETDDIIYTDTDSIILKNFEKHKGYFNIGTKMGQWRVVFRNREAFIAGEKRYRIEDDVKVSGIARKNLKREDFDRGEMTNQRMITIRQGLRGFGEIGTFNSTKSKIKTGCKKDIEIMESVIHDKGKENNI